MQTKTMCLNATMCHPLCLLHSFCGDLLWFLHHWLIDLFLRFIIGLHLLLDFLHFSLLDHLPLRVILFGLQLRRHLVSEFLFRFRCSNFDLIPIILGYHLFLDGIGSVHFVRFRVLFLLKFSSIRFRCFLCFGDLDLSLWLFRIRLFRRRCLLRHCLFLCDRHRFLHDLLVSLHGLSAELVHLFNDSFRFQYIRFRRLLFLFRLCFWFYFLSLLFLFLFRLCFWLLILLLIRFHCLSLFLRRIDRVCSFFFVLVHRDGISCDFLCLRRDHIVRHFALFLVGFDRIR